MSTFQTLLSVVVLIFVVSVIVQAIQEVVKAALGTKASVMEQTVTKFMGNHLTLPQLTNALQSRGLTLPALETFDVKAFRALLDVIAFQPTQLAGLIQSAAATEAQVKDHMASHYEAARAAFQAAYTRRNKLFAVVISYVAVLVLNANLIAIYNQIAADPVAQQAIVAKAATVQIGQPQSGSLPNVYETSHKQIQESLDKFPILIRWSKWSDDFQRPWDAVLGLVLMGALVSLGAPFWNDVLKSLMGVNKTLNSNVQVRG